MTQNGSARSRSGRSPDSRSLSRRNVMRLAGAAGGAAVTFGAARLATAAPAAAGGSARTSSGIGGVVHPGMLHTTADFERIRAALTSGAQPYRAGWDVLAANRLSSSTWKPHPLPVVYRGSGSPENYVTLYQDLAAAYQNALRWRISGDTAHGDTARAILNAWSATLTRLDGTDDRYLAAGIYGYQFANAAELMRGYPGFDLARAQHLTATVFAPLSEAFLAHHNGAYPTNYWPNWDLVNTACVLAAGILCEDDSRIQHAVDYFLHGDGNGSIRNAIPVVRSDGLAEWLEACRDQGHTQLGVGMMGAICEMAWNQGIDLYGYDDNRFLKGAEYVARFNLGQGVPFTPYDWKEGAPGVWSGQQTFTAVSAAGRGMIRPIWAMIENHYARRRGLDAPYVSRIAAKAAPEGGGGDYGPNSGGFDQLGFGTLMFTRDRGAADARTMHAAQRPGAAGRPDASPSSPSSPSSLPSTPSTPSLSALAARGGAGAGGGSATGHLAGTGGGEAGLYAGAAGLAALAVGLLLPRRNRTR